jgi:hypothetical protein
MLARWKIMGSWTLGTSVLTSEQLVRYSIVSEILFSIICIPTTKVSLLSWLYSTISMEEITDCYGIPIKKGSIVSVPYYNGHIRRGTVTDVNISFGLHISISLHHGHIDDKQWKQKPRCVTIRNLNRIVVINNQHLIS